MMGAGLNIGWSVVGGSGRVVASFIDLADAKEYVLLHPAYVVREFGLNRFVSEQDAESLAVDEMVEPISF